MTSTRATAQPSISCVIPAYNESASLPVLLQQLTDTLPSRFPHWELIIVNDGSRDDTEIALAPWIAKGNLRYIALSPDAKPMAENLYRALWSWIICVVVTVVVSLFTQPKTESELQGLVYGYTEIPSDGDLPFYQRPVFWGVGVAIVFGVLQYIFW